MKMQVQPNRWSCLPTSFAMVFNIPLEMIISKLGHDGSEIILPDQPEPLNRRSFHPAEIIDFGFNVMKCGVIEIAPKPMFDLSNHFDKKNLKYHDNLAVWDTEYCVKRMLRYLAIGSGVFVGKTGLGKNHAVAWNHREQHIYDPNGSIYPLSKENFTIEIFFKVCQLDLSSDCFIS